MKPSIDQQIEAVRAACTKALVRGEEDLDPGNLAAALETLQSVKGHAPDQIEPQLVTQTNYKDVVAVALAFADPTASDEDVLVRILRALRGMTNPSSVTEEIRRQRHG